MKSASVAGLAAGALAGAPLPRQGYGHGHGLGYGVQSHYGASQAAYRAPQRRYRAPQAPLYGAGYGVPQAPLL